MGLFGKKPNAKTQVFIQTHIDEVQTQYKYLTKVDRVDWFLEAYDKVYKEMNYLLDAEKKYP